MLDVMYGECHLYRISFMLSVANKPFMISAIMLKIIMLSITMLNVMASSVNTATIPSFGRGDT